MGGPGAGKGTMCSRVAAEFRYVHLSMGDLLREERTRPGSQFAAIIEENIMQGALVPADVTVGVLMEAIKSQDDWKHSKFVIDGFPRNLEQVEAWNKLVGSSVTMKSCLFFDCSDKNMERRLLTYASDSEQAREDDTVDIIKKRIENFRKDVTFLQRHFQYEGLLERIDSNRDIEKVWHDVQAYFVVQAYNDTKPGGDASHASPVKAIWKLRDKQCEEMFPTGHSHTSTTYTKGTHARQFQSYTILARHRDKHTRNMRSPMDNYVEPMTLAQEIGWHQADDGENIGAKGTPRGMGTPRAFYPRNTCAMTRHLENMYSTNAQHIIRRW